MNHLKTMTVTSVLLCGLFGNANAELFDRGGGLIYDSILNVTWLQDAGLGGSSNWADATTWADNLVVAGYEDWRLPSMDLNGDGGIVECFSASEVDCQDNELGYMFYYSLMGNIGGGLIENLAAWTYWSGTNGPTIILPPYDDGPPPDFGRDIATAWTFDFGSYGPDFIRGFTTGQDVRAGAWAVRSGDVAAVPLPAGIWLLGSALLGVAGMGHRGRRC